MVATGDGGGWVIRGKRRMVGVGDMLVSHAERRKAMPLQPEKRPFQLRKCHLSAASAACHMPASLQREEERAHTLRNGFSEAVLSQLSHAHL